jgi:hypothetical protein
VTSPTFPDALPFPIQGDFADLAQQAYETAMRVDQFARDADNAFALTYRPRSFCYRVNATFTAGVGDTFFTNLAVEWDTSNTPTANFPTGSWTQDRVEPQSWWMIGASLNIANTAGVANIGDHVDLMFNWSGTDQLSKAAVGSGSATPVGFTAAAEMNAGGESLSNVTILSLYQAQVLALIQVFGPGTATRTVQTTSRFWGVRLAPVAL